MRRFSFVQLVSIVVPAAAMSCISSITMAGASCPCAQGILAYDTEDVVSFRGRLEQAFTARAGDNLQCRTLQFLNPTQCLILNSSNDVSLGACFTTAFAGLGAECDDSLSFDSGNGEQSTADLVVEGGAVPVPAGSIARAIVSPASIDIGFAVGNTFELSVEDDGQNSDGVLTAVRSETDPSNPLEVKVPFTVCEDGHFSLTATLVAGTLVGELLGCPPVCNGTDETTGLWRLFCVTGSTATVIDQGAFELEGCSYEMETKYAFIPEGNYIISASFTSKSSSCVAVFDGKDREVCATDHSFDIDVQFSDLTFDPCPADTNDDGAVDALDYLAVSAQWGDCPAGCQVIGSCSADVNFDGVVDAGDILDVIAAWGPCP
jgi:hypothetical protein